MAVPSILAFFVVSHLLILQYSTGEGNTRQHGCPESFNCGALGPIKFPLSDATHPLCGLCVVNCSKKPVPELNLGWQQRYDIKEYLNNESLKVRDNRQGKLINSTSCDLFSRWIVPPRSSSISFTISPSLTAYKCYNISPELHLQAKAFFRGNYSTYGVCSGYTIYYRYPNPNHHQVPIPPVNRPPNCVVLELPVVPPNGKRNASDLISLLSAEFAIGLHVSNECRECHLNGGQCPRDTHKFQCLKEKGIGNFCINPKPKSKVFNPLQSGSSYFKLILGTVIPVGVFFLLCLLLLTIWCHNKWNYISSYVFSRNTSSDPSSKADLEGSSIYFGIPVFSYAELEAATNNFDPSKELGGRGFGTVYHGKLQDGRQIAVKRLYEHNYKRVTQFKNEIQILTRLRHRNLVSLYGCTSRLSRELLLVYEYIPNGTVADHLHGDLAKDGSLTWPIRMNIAIETANVLTYLHASDVIHRDVKTNNILLDNNFCVKVADFGLSRLFPANVTHASTAPQGTPGYVDPEYHQCYQLTEKSDVYSFGVVLIELISSMPAVDISRHRHEINLANLAMNRIQNRVFNELIDPSLGFESDSSIQRMTTSVAEVAFRCLQLEKEMRPTMDEVLECLKEIQEYKDENTGELIDNVEAITTSTQPPPSPEGDNAVLLKNSKVPPSSDSGTDRWARGSTTSISSTGQGFFPLC